jgi:5-methylcytosine-specific restriction enzyme subunit McrC
MIRRSIREWDYLPIGEQGVEQSIPRSMADQLIQVARSTPAGGEDGERILINGAKRLRAQQVVGILAAEGITLEILPKIDGIADDASTRRSLVHMLATVLDLEVTSGALADLGWQRYDLLEILIRLFCNKMFQAVHRGLPRRYIGCEDDLTSLRGRLDVTRQFTVLAASPQKLACRFENLSADIALNRIMKAALKRLSVVSRAPENQRRIAELLFAFGEISDVPLNALPWDQVVLDRTNDAWRELFRLAQLLLGRRFQTTASGDTRGFSLLFEMNKLFEEFIGRSLKRALGGTGLRVDLQGPQSHALVDHETERGCFTTRPDIVISQGSRRLMVADTKWKRLQGVLDHPRHGVSQSDIYQMMAYAQVYECERLMLLYPHHRGLSESDGLLSVHRISNRPTSRLAFATVSLAEPRSVSAQLRSLFLSPDIALCLEASR